MTRKGGKGRGKGGKGGGKRLESSLAFTYITSAQNKIAITKMNDN